MTCIAGLVCDGKVWIGADSVGWDEWSKLTSAEPKVFSRDGLVMGFTTSWRMGQLLRYRLEIPPLPTDPAELPRWAATGFVDAVRACFLAGGWASKNNDRESGGEFLVGALGRLFIVESSYQCVWPADGYAAVGSGYLHAVGSLYTTKQHTHFQRELEDPCNRLILALSAAEHHARGVRGPFTILEG